MNLGFVTDENERGRLRERLEQIDMALGAVDHYLSGTGKILPLKNSLISRFKASMQSIKLKELELEVSNIRLQLFGRWDRWEISWPKLDKTMSEVIGSGALSFSKSTLHDGKCFELALTSDTYATIPEAERYDIYVDAGIADLVIKGHFYPKALFSSPSFRKHPPSIWASLKLHYGHHHTEGCVVPLPDSVKDYIVSPPDKVVPRSWSSLLSLR